mmetsp:Transcript_29031/g.50215  ORF Transcript_29031/g.50215 Transcript_29031/m.50215 type:complete len:241 (+) Transcript_29031:46-768(+)
MGVTAENLAEKYGITREECDEYGFRSQMAWGEANKAGVFEAELAPVEVKGRKGPQLVTADESPRPDVQLEKMRSLKPVFKKDGCVTAGNASGISDGAGSVLLASEAAVAKYNLTPLARLAGWGRAGCAPEIMGIGPVPAIAGALAAAGTSLGEVGLVEINEAFAAQYLACEKELGLDRAVANKSGGAIALGHPLGASGARITAHLAHALATGRAGPGVTKALGSACIGGGQGIAVLLEKC